MTPIDAADDHAYSTGLLVAPLDGAAAVYDLTTDTVWFVQPLAGRVLQTSADARDDLAAELAHTVGGVLGLHSGGTVGPHFAVTDLRGDAVTVSGDLGVIDRIVLARYDPSVTDIDEHGLEPRAALEALVPTLLNLRRCGPDGWGALCRLCEEVPVSTLRHPDAHRAAARLLDAR